MPSLPPRCFSVAFGTVVLMMLVGATCASGTTMSNTLTQVVSFTITPSSGYIVFAPDATAYVAETNSLGENSYDFQRGTTANAAASITWATAAASADSLSLTGFASSIVTFPHGVNGTAHSLAEGGTFYFPFSVMGTTGPVVVQFSATVSYQQLLVTDINSRASSEVFYYADLPGNPPLYIFYEDLQNSVGPNSYYFDSATWNLTSFQSILAGQEYNFRSAFFAVSDATVVPEPPSLLLLLSTGPIVILVLRWVVRYPSH
jgi:hypothetical protein